jgi:hypothetical protein
MTFDCLKMPAFGCPLDFSFSGGSQGSCRAIAGQLRGLSTSYFLHFYKKNAHCLLPIAYCLLKNLPIAYCPLPIAYCLLNYRPFYNSTFLQNCLFSNLRLSDL